jgi:hypothetical protein
MKLHDRPVRTLGAQQVAVATSALLILLAAGGCDAGGIVTLTGSGAGGGDTTATTGAETTTASSSSTTATATSGGTGGCGPGVSTCGDSCADLENDPANCGDCGVVCAEGEVCSAGACGFECLGGATRCGDLCVDQENDPANCGDCDVACGLGEVCFEGACGLECGGGSTRCGDFCVDQQNDPANCGDCDVACGLGEVCDAGECAFGCVGGSTECDGACVDVENDPAHCGGCGEACAIGLACVDGECGLECVGGSTECGASCVDLQNDPENCGACGAPCAAGVLCALGECLVRPTVVDTNPDDGATLVPIDRPIVVTFSTPMDPLTIDEESFLVADGATPIFGDVTYDGLTATFVPAMSYPNDRLITATITTAAEDLSGLDLEEDYVWTFRTGTVIALPPIDLGEAADFAILSFNTVTNVNNVGTIVTGDIGISPGSALVGFPPGEIIGSIFLADLAAQAQLDLLAAYNDAVARPAAVLPGDLSGLTFAPGVYGNATSVMLSAGNVTLDAQGDQEALFVFQMGTTLTTGPGTQVILSGGARATNVFWAVGSSATIGTTSAFQGTIMAEQAITMNTGASLVGRILAQGAAVSLDTNVITVPAP